MTYAVTSDLETNPILLVLTLRNRSSWLELQCAWSAELAIINIQFAVGRVHRVVNICSDYHLAIFVY